MKVECGVFSGKRHNVVLWDGDALALWKADAKPSIIARGLGSIRLLTASPDEKYLAFWAGSDTSFHLMDIEGKEVWSHWTNTDKNEPASIHFSPEGLKVACIDSGEYGSFLTLHHIKNGITTQYNSCMPIGFDSDLNNFVEAPFVPPLWKLDCFYLSEQDPQTGKRAKVQQDEFIRRLSDPLTVMDSRRNVINYAPIISHNWKCLGIQKGCERFVVLRDHSISWFSEGSANPEATIEDCIPGDLGFYFCSLDIDQDLALVRPMYGSQGLLINKNSGIVCKVDGLLVTELKDQRLIAQFTDGSVSVVQSNGVVVRQHAPLPWFKTIAADITDDMLYIAYVLESKEKLEIRDYSLG